MRLLFSIVRNVISVSHATNLCNRSFRVLSQWYCPRCPHCYHFPHCPIGLLSPLSSLSSVSSFCSLPLIEYLDVKMKDLWNLHDKALTFDETWLWRKSWFFPLCCSPESLRKSNFKSPAITEETQKHCPRWLFPQVCMYLLHEQIQTFSVLISKCCGDLVSSVIRSLLVPHLGLVYKRCWQCWRRVSQPQRLEWKTRL